MNLTRHSARMLFIWLALFLLHREQAMAQRMGHGASRSSFNRGGGNSRSINGGSYRSPSRTAPTQQPSRSPSAGTGDPGRNYESKNKAPASNDRSASVSTNDNKRKNGNTNIGNDANINSDRSRDININNQNTVVRKNNVAVYHRPPYMHGGHAYYCHHPYAYHPYHGGYYWGPSYNPWGAFVAVLAVTAIVVAVNNQQYQYDDGVWYQDSNGGHTVVQAPVGGSVTNIPNSAETVVVNNTTNYYYGGAYYEKSGSEYKVVPPPAGAVVENLPQGGEEVKIGDQTYVKVGETYYQPVEVDGKAKYEVSQVEESAK
jgi:hypothetical protein